MIVLFITGSCLLISVIWTKYRARFTFVVSHHTCKGMLRGDWDTGPTERWGHRAHQDCIPLACGFTPPPRQDVRDVFPLFVMPVSGFAPPAWNSFIKLRLRRLVAYGEKRWGSSSIPTLKFAISAGQHPRHITFVLLCWFKLVSRPRLNPAESSKGHATGSDVRGESRGSSHPLNSHAVNW